MIKALCIGELLWDIFPDKKVWGGAPANFIFHTAQFGADATAYTAVGNDELGDELVKAALKTDIKLNAQKVNFPTGVVNVNVDEDGVATYQFNKNCAWDQIPLSEDLKKLSSEADLITFGTLAQRSQTSRQTIINSIKMRKASAKVLFDINIRQNFYSKEIIEESLKEADFLKLNEEEVIVLYAILGKNLQEIQSEYSLELIILTLGPDGSQIKTIDTTYDCPAFPCKIIDTVGAGDSFTACFIINYLNGLSIPQAQELASRVAAYVCEHSGATISIPDHLKLLATIGN